MADHTPIRRAVCGCRLIDNADEDIPAALFRCSIHEAAPDLLEALEVVTAELAGWGWGDHHYGSQPQEPRVVDAVLRGRAAIAKAKGEA
jgi:hypothetical protein